MAHTNFTIYKQVLQYWDTLMVGQVVYFNLCSDTKELVDYLTLLVQISVKFTPNFAFKVKKIFNRLTLNNNKKINYKEEEKKEEIR